jgi:choline dehydrogenase
MTDAGTGVSGRDGVPADEGISDEEEVFDVVVVGSGAGGGPLAARLAEAGTRVLLLEAGDAVDNDDYAVPAFHARATEDPSVRWDYFVQHYQDPEQARRDSKYVAGKGVWYPRAGSVGGCTSHHAMITMYPHNSDWDGIAAATGDRSWRSGRMRAYFERIERCGYRPRPRMLPRNRVLAVLLANLPLVSDRYVNRGRHGFDGWLPTSVADPKIALRDGQLVEMIVGAAEGSLASFLGRPLSPLEGLATFVDPNDWRAVKKAAQGVWLVPLSTARGRRSAVRERLDDVGRRCPDRLTVRSGTLVTPVLLDDAGAAIGVEYHRGPSLYRADPRAGPRAEPGRAAPPLQRALATREVVLAAGAFNTPQLLMLSGIGPREELQRHGVPVRVDLPGVGRNLQDRYEVGIVTEMVEDFRILEGLSFAPPVPGRPVEDAYREWREGRGVYATNGAVIGIVAKSGPQVPVPDLFLFGLPADFRGYAPGYAGRLEQSRRRFTWAVLKAHTVNCGGRVVLRSADPMEPPEVCFSYFDEGTDTRGEDLAAVVSGIGLVRAVNGRAREVIARELVPGEEVDTDEKLRAFARAESWGHHACGTCKMGRPDDRLAVVDSSFRVIGVDRLRVVDASVFPRIPGFFIVTPTYMVSEKAAEVMLAPAGGALRTRAARLAKALVARADRRGFRQWGARHRAPVPAGR